MKILNLENSKPKSLLPRLIFFFFLQEIMNTEEQKGEKEQKIVYEAKHKVTSVFLFLLWVHFLSATCSKGSLFCSALVKSPLNTLERFLH